jgi:hypothetical protein
VVDLTSARLFLAAVAQPPVLERFDSLRAGRFSNLKSFGQGMGHYGILRGARAEEKTAKPGADKRKRDAVTNESNVNGTLRGRIDAQSCA